VIAAVTGSVSLNHRRFVERKILLEQKSVFVKYVSVLKPVF
jgi:hypothetical protein